MDPSMLGKLISKFRMFPSKERNSYSCKSFIAKAWILEVEFLTCFGKYDSLLELLDGNEHAREHNKLYIDVALQVTKEN